MLAAFALFGRFIAAHWKAGLVLAAVVALFALGWHEGASRVQTAWDAEKALQAKTVQKTVVAQTKDALALDAVTLYRFRTEDAKTQTIIKEVPKYVTVQDDSQCSVPDGFVSLWNGANTGNLPGSASDADDASKAGGTVFDDTASQPAAG